MWLKIQENRKRLSKKRILDKLFDTKGRRSIVRFYLEIHSPSSPLVDPIVHTVFLLLHKFLLYRLNAMYFGIKSLSYDLSVQRTTGILFTLQMKLELDKSRSSGRWTRTFGARVIISSPKQLQLFFFTRASFSVVKNPWFYFLVNRTSEPEVKTSQSSQESIYWRS